jgi:hypothetical protein
MAMFATEAQLIKVQIHVPYELSQYLIFTTFAIYTSYSNFPNNFVGSLLRKE